MLPHPTTMSFAWDKDVLRGARMLLFVFGLTIAVLLGGATLIHRVTDTSPAVTADRITPGAHLVSSRSGAWRNAD
jgi:hypothetical protein